MKTTEDEKQLELMTWPQIDDVIFSETYPIASGNVSGGFSYKWLEVTLMRDSVKLHTLQIAKTATVAELRRRIKITLEASP